MRILYIYNINRVAEIHARELALRNHSTLLYQPDLSGGLSPLPIKLMKMPKRLFDLRHIVGKLNSKYFDLVHIHWASYAFLGFACQIPFIVECHGTDVRARLKNPFFRLLLVPGFRRAAAILCITPDLLPIVRTVRPDAQFFPAPVDTQQFAPFEDPPSNSEHPWTILLFMRLDPEKGPDVAIDGILRFIERHPNVRVKMLDWGLLKEKLKRKYGKRFEFIALVPPDQVPELILSADVVVGQLLSGAFGLSELQAMSCAKPVICSFNYDEVYPEAPPICKAATPAQVDKHLEVLFQRPDLGADLGQKARDWIITNHSYQILSQRLEELYCSILS